MENYLYRHCLCAYALFVCICIDLLFPAHFRDVLDSKKAVERVNNGKRKHEKSALDDILAEEERRREKKNRRDYWLHEVG